MTLRKARGRERELLRGPTFCCGCGFGFDRARVRFLHIDSIVGCKKIKLGCKKLGWAKLNLKKKLNYKKLGWAELPGLQPRSALGVVPPMLSMAPLG